MVGTVAMGKPFHLIIPNTLVKLAEDRVLRELTSSGSF